MDFLEYLNRKYEKTPEVENTGSIKWTDTQSIGSKVTSGVKKVGTNIADYFKSLKNVKPMDVVKEIPNQLSVQIGQPSMRAYGGFANWLLGGKGLKPEGQFQQDLYGTDKPITFTSVGEEVVGQGPIRSKYVAPAVGAFFAVADITPAGKPLKEGAKKIRPLLSQLVRLADEAEIQTTLRPLGLSDDAARELSQSIRLINTESNMGMGARSREIQNIVDDVLKRANAIPEGAGKSVVQVVDTKTGKNIFYEVPPEEFNGVRQLIDDARNSKGFGGVAGDSIDGKIFHVTAKTPSQMLERAGWKNGGQKTLDDIVEMITPKKRVPIRYTDGTFAGSFIDDTPAFKLAARNIDDEYKVILDRKSVRGEGEFDLTIPEAETAFRNLFTKEEAGFIIRNEIKNGKQFGNFSRQFKSVVEVVQKEGKVQSDTVYHESFHTYFNTFMSQAERQDILSRMKDSLATSAGRGYKVFEGYRGADIRAEEWLADDFARYMREISQNKKPTSIFAEVWQKVVRHIRQMIRKANHLDQLYADIVARKRNHIEKPVRKPIERAKNADDAKSKATPEEKKSTSEKEYDSILTQLSGAEKGERIGVTGPDGNFAGYRAKGSTFPEWVPQELRLRSIFDDYMDKRTGSLEDFKITYKENSRLARLDEIVRQRVFEKTGEDVRLMPQSDTYYDSLADEYMELTATEVKERQLQSRSIREGTASQGMPRDILDPEVALKMSSLDKSIHDSDSLVNLTKLDVSPEAKKFLEATVEDVKPYAEKKVGETLTNKEMLEYAEKNARMLERAVGREQTMAWEAAMFNARENLARLAERGIVDQEYIDALVNVKALGADLGRKLQSLSIKAQPNEAKALDAVLEEVLKVADNAEEVLKAAEGVDFKNYKETAEFYRKFVKPRMGEWIDMLRYNSMLSSPLTHIVNIFSNLVNSALIGTAEKLTVGAFDMVRGTLTNTGRERFAGEAGVFLKEYMSNIGEATDRFAQTIKGERAITNLDTRSIPLATSGPAKAVESVLTVPMRFLEAADQFFTALTEAGELGALKYRQSKGVKVSAPIVKAQEAAQYRLYRQELFSEGQGTVLNAIDHVTNTIYNLRNSENPIISNIFKFTVPFIRTPTNIFKQGVEYSPLGVTTLAGASDKELQLAKAAIGTTIFAGAAVLLASDRLSWAEPTSDKERNMWRDAGKQPYSIKIGDTWVSYQKLPPPLAFPISMVSVINDAQKTRKIEDSTIEMILGGIAKYGSFLADQSYAKSMGDLLSAVKGGESDWARVIGNVPQQLVPYRALGGWLSKLLDNVQRKPDPEGTFIEKQVQLLMMNIPGLSDNAPARKNQFGEEITNDQNIINAFSPVRISEEKPRGIEILTKYMNSKLESAKTKDARATFKEEVFLPIQTMSDEEAKKKLDAMSDEEYEMYKSVRTAWRSSNMSTVRDYLDYDPREAVTYVRSLPDDEADRIINLLTDEEYALYQTGKSEK